MFRRRVARVVAAVAATSVVVSVAWLSVRHRSVGGPTAGARRLLLESLAGARTFDARIAGVERFQAIGDTPTPEKAIAVAQLEMFARDSASGAEASAMLGVARLYRGQSDAALDLLGDAVYEAPGVAEYWCDLAAASLVRDRSTDRLAALDAAERGIQLEPGLAACRFNRALALERVGLLAFAQDAWETLAGAPDPGWSREARAHAATVAGIRRALTRTLSLDELIGAEGDGLVALVRRSVDESRRLLEDELVPRIGRVCRDDTSECSRLVERLVAVAAALESVSPDRQPRYLATQIVHWASRGRRSESADVLALYGDARRQAENDELSKALPSFGRIADTFQTGFPALAANARFYICVDAYFRAAHAEARTCLDRLEKTASASGFIFLRGRIHWVRAQVSLADADFAGSMRAFDAALALLRQANDRNQTAAVESLKATLLDQLGDMDEAWGSRIGALTHAQLPPRRRHTLLNGAARSCLLQRLPYAALDFQEQAILNATAWRRPGALVESFLNRALVRAALGRTSESEADLQQARRHLLDVIDARAHERFDGELTVGEGELAARVSPALAVDVLNRASTRLAAMRFDLLSVRLFQAFGLAFERLGRRQEALAAYRTGIGVVERQREPLAAVQQMQMLDLAWDMYEHLITQELSEDRSGATALDTVEASRTHILRPRSADAEREMSATALLHQLPPRVVVSYLSVLEDETIRWTLSTAGTRMHRFPMPRRTVEHWVLQVRRAWEHASRRTGGRVPASPLFDLIVPNRADLTPGTMLVVILDGPLYQLPVAALVDPLSGKYLIQARPVAIAPSLAVFVAASTEARKRFQTLDTALVVGGASGGEAGASSLPALPGTIREIDRVAASYVHSDILAGATATPARFLAMAGSYRVVHFAGHAVANRVQPELSRLHLAPDATQNGWLLLRELQSTSFPRTAIVVLAACDTAVGPIYHGEGVLNLARPFLGKGVPAVVNTLWRVDDASTARLLEAFHAYIRAGLQPIVALQRAQRDHIERSADGDDPSTWAAFQYVGGVDTSHLTKGAQ